MAACPPYHGIHWWCGQESSVRLLAVLIGAWACGDLNGERWEKLLRLAWATGYRVEHHINYAISQKNNHAISEALGLMLVGHLFPELRESMGWFRKGRKVMESELRRQCYADGSYVQHSMNYHRVMLEGASLGIRIAELAGEPLDRDLYEIVGRSAEFLYQMTDPHSGFAPNYGNNDGAHIFPLSECDFCDMRPAAQAAYFAAHRRRLLPPGVWDGELIWLMGDEVAGMESETPAEASKLVSQSFEVGGYHTLRDDAGDSWLMTRCHRYRDRMGQCDMLHVDLWAGGVNWLCDSGTFRYYIPGQESLERFFGSQAAHNVIQIDGVDVSEKAGRFLLFPWAKADLLRGNFVNGEGAYFEGVSLDHQRKPWQCVWKRVIKSLGEGLWVIVDDLIGTGEHSVRWWWHLCPGEHKFEDCADGSLQLSLNPEASPDRRGVLAFKTSAPECRGHLKTAKQAKLKEQAIRNGIDAEPQGMSSSYYGHLQFLPVLQFDWVGTLPLRAVSVVNTLGEATISSCNAREWQVSADHRNIILVMSEISAEAKEQIIISQKEVES